MSYATSDHHISRRGLLSILSAAILWGTVGVTTQTLYGLSSTSALSIGFFRLAFATPLLFIASWFILKRRIFQIKRRDAIVMMLMGIMLALYQIAFFAAIAYCGVATSTLITLCTAPVLVTLYSLLVFRERITLTTILAMLCALVGTLLLVISRSTAHALNFSLIGVLLALFAAAGYAGIILCGQFVANRYHPLHINAVANGTGAILLLCIAPVIHLAVVYPLQSWLLLFYLGSVPTALAYGLFLFGVRSTSATVTSIVTLCEPLTAALLAYLFFGESLGVLGLVGAVLLVGAILLLTYSSRRSR